jgi:hypothetical protein
MKAPSDKKQLKAVKDCLRTRWIPASMDNGRVPDYPCKLCEVNSESLDNRPNCKNCVLTALNPKFECGEMNSPYDVWTNAPFACGKALEATLVMIRALKLAKKFLKVRIEANEIYRKPRKETVPHKPRTETVPHKPGTRGD